MIFYKYHLNKYTYIQTEDKIKLIYQGMLGPNHLNLNKDMVKPRIEKELQEENDISENIYEWISSDYIRVNICKYIALNNSLDNLVDNFVKSSNTSLYTLDDLKKELNTYLTPNELKDYNYQPISHSNIYRNKYLPHYLVINKEYLDISLRTQNLDNFMKTTKEYTITSVEGKCTSGKTTITSTLANKYTVIQIDQFFLSKDRKTKERLAEIGGNIDYELVKENLQKIKKAWYNNQDKVEMKVYDCSTNTYHQEVIELKDKVILEGVYSYHKYFNNLIDYLVYIYVDEKTQLERVNTRNMKERFINEWIPLENKYFDAYKLYDICDLII